MRTGAGTATWNGVNNQRFVVFAYRLVERTRAGLYKLISIFFALVKIVWIILTDLLKLKFLNFFNWIVISIFLQ